jgi:hypothetical protein
MRNCFRWVIAAAITAMLPLLAARGTEPPILVLDNARIIDATGAAPIEHGRIVVRGDRYRTASNDPPPIISPRPGSSQQLRT